MGYLAFQDVVPLPKKRLSPEASERMITWFVQSSPAAVGVNVAAAAADDVTRLLSLLVDGFTPPNNQPVPLFVNPVPEPGADRFVSHEAIPRMSHAA
jgi:hypothetical protein